jgi:hypothetical protein
MSLLNNLLGSPHFHALSLVLVSAAAIEALIAFWAATSRRHWFWRALVVCIGVLALLPIGAYQPALVFAISSPLTIAAIVAIQPRSSTAAGDANRDGGGRLSRIRYGLGDLLLATALVGLVIAALLKLLPRLGPLHAGEFAVTTATQTILPILAWLSVASGRPRFWLAAFVVAVIGLAGLAYAIRRTLGYEWYLIGVLFESSRLQVIEVPPTPLVELALLTLASAGVVHFGLWPSGRSPFSRTLRRVGLAAAGVWGICLAAIYFQMLWLIPWPPPFNSQSNHYRRLIDISQQMLGIEKAGFPKNLETQRQTLIAEMMPLLETANYVPYELPEDATSDRWNKVFIMPAQHVRSLARALDFECGAALASGQTDRAVGLIVANIRLGVMLQRGGTVVEDLIGVAIHGVANARIAKLRAQLSPAQARSIIEAWDRAIAEQEDVESIINRDRAMAERAFGWASRLNNILERAGLPSEIYWGVTEAQHRRVATTGLLQADLAIRLYQQEHGALPQNLGQLMPEYLSQIPPDGYSKQPLVYQPGDKDFVLYSIGHDRRDNGGTFTNMRTYYSRDFFGNLVTGYDYDLDTLTRP